MLARERRHIALQHPWSVEASPRPAVGPNPLRGLVVSLAAYDELDIDISDELDIDMSSVGWGHRYRRAVCPGAVALEMADSQARRNTRMSEAERRAALQPYMCRGRPARLKSASL